MIQSRILDRKVLVTSIAILLMGSSFLELGYTQTIFSWQVNFNEGSFDDWQIEGGIFSIVNGTLVCQGILLWPDLATIYHESHGVYGNWSFDISGFTPSIWFIASSPNHRNVSGYRFARVVDNESHYLGLFRVLNGSETRIAYSATANDTNWAHIDIVRTMGSIFTVNLNDSPIFSVTDANISTSNMFVFGAYSPGASIDNITVNTIMRDTPTETTTLGPDVSNPLVYGLTAAALMTCVILVVEIPRRRRLSRLDA